MAMALLNLWFQKALDKKALHQMPRIPFKRLRMLKMLSLGFTKLINLSLQGHQNWNHHWRGLYEQGLATSMPHAYEQSRKLQMCECGFLSMK
jgi:hypothetical protein